MNLTFNSSVTFRTHQKYSLLLVFYSINLFIRLNSKFVSKIYSVFCSHFSNVYTAKQETHSWKYKLFKGRSFFSCSFSTFFFLFNTVSQHPREITTLLSYPYIFNSKNLLEIVCEVPKLQPLVGPRKISRVMVMSQEKLLFTGIPFHSSFCHH